MTTRDTCANLMAANSSFRRRALQSAHFGMSLGGKPWILLLATYIDIRFCCPLQRIIDDALGQHGKLNRTTLISAPLTRLHMHSPRLCRCLKLMLRFHPMHKRQYRCQSILLSKQQTPSATKKQLAALWCRYGSQAIVAVLI